MCRIDATRETVVLLVVVVDDRLSAEGTRPLSLDPEEDATFMKSMPAREEEETILLLLLPEVPPSPLRPRLLLSLLFLLPGVVEEGV